MKPLAKFNMIGILPFIATCFAAFIYLMGQQELNTSQEKAMMLDDLYKTITRLMMASNRYIANPTALHEQLWQEQFIASRAMMKSVQTVTYSKEGQQFYQEIDRYIRQVSSLFEECSIIRKGQSEQSLISTSSERFKALGIRIIDTLQEALPVVNKMHDISHNSAHSIFYRQNIIGFSLLAFLALLIPLTISITRKMSISFSQLLASMAEVAVGFRTIA